MGVATAEFDWLGVVTGHWLVVSGEFLMLDTGTDPPVNRTMYRCVSKCGIVTTYRASTLGIGAPATCVRCRVSAGHRVRPTLKVCDPDLFRARFEEGPAMLFCDTSKVDGRGRRVWESHGLALVDELVALTGLGRDYGWKVFVRHMSDLSDRHRAQVKVGDANERNRSMELKVYTGAGNVFMVSLSTGRSDRPWGDVVARVRAAAARNSGDQPEDPAGGSIRTATGDVRPAPVAAAPAFANQHAPAPRHAAPAPAPVADPSSPGAVLAGLAGMDQEQITMLRAGLEEVALAGVEARSVQSARAKAAEDVAARARELEGLERDAEATKAEMDGLDRQLRIGRSALEELERKVADARAAQVLAGERYQAAEARHAELGAKIPAARDELELSKMALEDAQRDERRVAESLKGAEKIGPILAALRAAGVVR